MINTNKILLDKEQCLGHTWLTPELFWYLLGSFEVEYRIHMERRYREEHGHKRKRKQWWWRLGKLDTMEKKLFFGLCYLKTYQTYETLWWAFDMKRPRAYEWIDNILPPILEALKKTVWFLQPQLKNWLSCWQDTQKWRRYLSMLPKDLYKEIEITKHRKRNTHERRKDTQRRTS